MKNSQAIFHPVAPGIDVIERGWLNANQTILWDADGATIVDSGYHTHAEFTVKLLREHPAHAVGYQRLLNTHCHSDHMGGNAAIVAAFNCEVKVPVGEMRHIVPWDPQNLWLGRTGQSAPPFVPNAVIHPGEIFVEANCVWRAYPAAGHDDDALIFYCQEHGVLITGDALWQSGVGFVWPNNGDQLQSAASRALETLDLIETLQPHTIIPGHGAPFTEGNMQVTLAITNARAKLRVFEKDPQKCARNAARSFIVFNLLQYGKMSWDELIKHIQSTPVYSDLMPFLGSTSSNELANELLTGLIDMGAIIRVNDECGKQVLCATTTA